MKKLLTIFCAFILCIGLVGCSSKEPFEIKEITATKLQKKLDHKDSFVLIIERENCPYCESLQEYFLYTPTLYVIENGKATHAGIGYSEDDHSISLWDVDSTIDFDLADTQEFWEFLETYE